MTSPAKNAGEAIIDYMFTNITRRHEKIPIKIYQPMRWSSGLMGVSPNPGSTSKNPNDMAVGTGVRTGNWTENRRKRGKSVIGVTIETFRFNYTIAIGLTLSDGRWMRTCFNKPAPINGYINSKIKTILSLAKPGLPMASTLADQKRNDTPGRIPWLSQTS